MGRDGVRVDSRHRCVYFFSDAPHEFLRYIIRMIGVGNDGENEKGKEKKKFDGEDEEGVKICENVLGAVLFNLGMLREVRFRPFHFSSLRF
jgi:hypothetical protein